MVGEDLVGARAGDALVDLHNNGDRGQFEVLAAVVAHAGVHVADAEGGEGDQQGEEEGEVGFSWWGTFAEEGRIGKVSGLVVNGDASCLQGGDLFIAGLVTEGVACQIYLIAFTQAGVSD